jgi:phenylalanyl-tRNA synthetase alpha chain
VSTTINKLEQQALSLIDDASSVSSWNDARVALLGKNGSITLALKSIKAIVDVAEKKQFAQDINKLKAEVVAKLATKQEALLRQQQQRQLEQSAVDVTLPVVAQSIAGVHPITAVIAQAKAIFAKHGFIFNAGNDIESDYYNFTALNFPAHHPARDMHDTFFIKGNGEDMVLRTHTSSVQIHAMKGHGVPIRLITAGRTYRCDSDATHTPMFHQIEALCIDREVNLSHMKFLLEEFLAEFFQLNGDVPMRFRPSYFPFTEPSFEVDIACKHNKDGLLIGQGDDWLEVLGCGMVHPNVLENCGVDSNIYQGFAFGMGVERLAMLKYNIKDLRQFFDGNLHWLSHYQS